MLIALVSSCGVGREWTEGCRGSLDARNAHSAALLAVGVPDDVVISGAFLIEKIDAVCRG